MLVEKANFDLKQIAESGQCFRMTELAPSLYQIIAGNHYVLAEQLEENLINLFCSNEEFELIWYDYFDLGYDYTALVDRLINAPDVFLSNAAAYGHGIRILQQDPFEMTISFILSQNKNIPAIMKSIESLCLMFGEKKEVSKTDLSCFTDQRSHYTIDEIICFLPLHYYAFPTPAILAAAELGDLKKTKAGYRSEYIKRASASVAEKQLNLEALRTLPSALAISALKTLHGVGDKVANCIALFGLHHVDVFPVDVWIKRILSEHYNDSFKVELYDGYAGIVQQYMFYYIRACS